MDVYSSTRVGEICPYTMYKRRQLSEKGSSQIIGLCLKKFKGSGVGYAALYMGLCCARTVSFALQTGCQSLVVHPYWGQRGGDDDTEDMHAFMTR